MTRDGQGLVRTMVDGGGERDDGAQLRLCTTKLLVGVSPRGARTIDPSAPSSTRASSSSSDDGMSAAASRTSTAVWLEPSSPGADKADRAHDERDAARPCHGSRPWEAYAWGDEGRMSRHESWTCLARFGRLAGWFMGDRGRVMGRTRRVSGSRTRTSQCAVATRSLRRRGREQVATTPGGGARAPTPADRRGVRGASRARGRTPHTDHTRCRGHRRPRGCRPRAA